MNEQNKIYYETTIFILLSGLIILCSLKFKIDKFLTIFLFINLIYFSSGQINFIIHFFDKKDIVEFKNKSIEINKSNQGINIYYVVMDGLTSLERLRTDFKISTQETENTLIKNGFFISKNAKSSYNITHLTLASIFSLDYLVNENSNRYIGRHNFFPNNLHYPSDLPLFVELKKSGYKFTYVGNKWNGCVKNELVNCIDGVGVPTKFYLLELMKSYSLVTFFNKTPIWHLISNISEKYELEYKEYKKNKIVSMNDNDAIKTVLNILNAGEVRFAKNNFFFVHHLNPHPPALNEDCSASSSSGYLEWTEDGYRKSSKCALLRIQELIEAIERADPNAMVIIQGDHGPSIKYDWDIKPSNLNKSQLDERFSIFNAIKPPKFCSPKYSDSLGNVETIRLVIDCLNGINLPPPQSKHYAGVYEANPEFGLVFPIKFNSNDGQK